MARRLHDGPFQHFLENYDTGYPRALFLEPFQRLSAPVEKTSLEKGLKYQSSSSNPSKISTSTRLFGISTLRTTGGI